MRKTGLITAAIGAALSLLLFLVRQTEWFEAQMAQTMSEFGELADSAFWAALIMTGLGPILFLLGLRPDAPAEEAPEPTPLAVEWVCPHCGGVNLEPETHCQTCGAARPGTPPGWTCTWCGAENPGTASVCGTCGGARVRTWTCENCGTENPDEAIRCRCCGLSRIGRPKPVRTCPSCGCVLEETDRICPECGYSLALRPRRSSGEERRSQ